MFVGAMSTSDGKYILVHPLMTSSPLLPLNFTLRSSVLSLSTSPIVYSLKVTLWDPPSRPCLPLRPRLISRGTPISCIWHSTPILWHSAPHSMCSHIQNGVRGVTDSLPPVSNVRHHIAGPTWSK